MKESLFFVGLLANFLSYAGEFYFQIDAKIKSAIPEVAFYDDADAFLDDDFFYKTVDLTHARRKEIFVQLFARNFGFHIWAAHRKKLAEIAGVLYQTILYERERRGRLAITDFDSLGNMADEEVCVEIIYDEE